jgi:transcription elongation factor GreA
MSDVTLSEAADRFLESVKGPSRQRAIAEVNRFVHWYGGEKRVGQMSGHEVSLYADVMGPAQTDTSKRADEVRAFLQFLKKKGLAQSNLAPHLRLKKNTSRVSRSTSKAHQQAVELTADGVAALESELDSLQHQRVAVREEIKRAMLDKDFRENAPLDAAKDKQGHLEARIREVETTLKHAVVVAGSVVGARLKVGSKVIVRNLGKGAEQTFSIVGPTEANVADGKISSVSPVGKALLGCSVGDEVEVSVPAGSLKFKIEKIDS